MEQNDLERRKPSPSRLVHLKEYVAHVVVGLRMAQHIGQPGRSFPSIFDPTWLFFVDPS